MEKTHFTTKIEKFLLSMFCTKSPTASPPRLTASTVSCTTSPRSLLVLLSGNKSTSAACGRYSELIYCAAVDKIEEKRKPEDFIGHRKRGRNCNTEQHNANRQNKCPKTLENTGLSGILCFNEKCFATLLQQVKKKRKKE